MLYYLTSFNKIWLLNILYNMIITNKWYLYVNNYKLCDDINIYKIIY